MNYKDHIKQNLDATKIAEKESIQPIYTDYATALKYGGVLNYLNYIK